MIMQHRIACMGGWCQSRNHCGAYHAIDRRFFAERICPKGLESPSPVRPVFVVKKVAV